MRKILTAFTMFLAAISREIGLSDVLSTAPELLKDNVRGRVVVDVNR